jgi:hypothetical protein
MEDFQLVTANKYGILTPEAFSILTSLIDSGFQRLAFPFLRVPELSPTSATELQLSSDSTTENVSSIIVSCSLVGDRASPQSCCPAAAVVPWSVYTAVAWQ